MFTDEVMDQNFIYATFSHVYWLPSSLSGGLLQKFLTGKNMKLTASLNKNTDFFEFKIAEISSENKSTQFNKIYIKNIAIFSHFHVEMLDIVH